MSELTEWQVLYHYTSLKSFERIVKNGYISLNDIIKSNDPAEGFFAFAALKEAYSKNTVRFSSTLMQSWSD